MATYVEKTLAGDENIIYRARYNWTYSVMPVFWFSLAAAPLVMLLAEQTVGGVPLSELKAAWGIGAAGFLCGSLILANLVIELSTTEFVVTSYRFVFKRGWIQRDTQEVSLNKIEEITLKQSIWGRLLGFGKLVIHGTGVGRIELPNIDNPIHVRRMIENARSDLRRGHPEVWRNDDD